MSCNADIRLTELPDKVAALEQIINTAKSTPVYVFFMMNWCGACQSLKKVFLSYRSLCTAQNAKATLVMVDGTSAPDIFAKYNIQVFPQVWVFVDRKVVKRIVGVDGPSLACSMKMVGLQLGRKEIQG